MEWGAIKNEFSVRLYRFAVKDFACEISNSFRLLRSIKGTEAIKTVDIFESLGSDEKQRLSSALLKRSHPRAVEVSGETLDQAENDILQKFDALRLKLGEEWKYLPVSSKRDFKRLFQRQNRPLPPEALTDPDLDGAKSNQLKKGEFLKLLKAEMPPVFKDKPIRCGANEWKFIGHWNGWTVNTHIDIGGRFHQLRYSHEIFWPSTPPLIRFLSIGGWLGLGDIGWDNLTEPDSKGAIESLSKLCKHFMDIVPELLDGLGPNLK